MKLFIPGAQPDQAHRPAALRVLRVFCVWMLVTALLVPGIPAAQAVALPRVEGLGAVVMDYQTGEVYFSRDADVPRPAASMTKLMSAYLVFEEIAAGNLSPDSYVIASPYAAQISSDPSYSGVEDLHAGDGYQVDDLLSLIMTASCNGSVIALAEHISGEEEKFVQRMNDKAEEWGIDAHFADCCGFEDEGNAVTPRAMAEIARHLIQDYPEILHYSSLRNFTFHGKVFYNTNSLLLNGTCQGIDGLKSGTTNGAGFCYTGTASRDGRRIISVVMKSWSYAMRMEDTRQMLEYGFARRAQRESQWAEVQSQLEVSITTDGDHLLPYSDNLLTATFSGLGELTVPCTLSWELNGHPIDEELTGFPLQEGGTAAILCKPPAGEGPQTVALVLGFPDGGTVRNEVELPTVSGSAVFMGRMGLDGVLRRASVRQAWETFSQSDGARQPVVLPILFGASTQGGEGKSSKTGSRSSAKSFACQFYTQPEADAS